MRQKLIYSLLFVLLIVLMFTDAKPKKAKQGKQAKQQAKHERKADRFAHKAAKQLANAKKATGVGNGKPQHMSRNLPKQQAKHERKADRFAQKAAKQLANAQKATGVGNGKPQHMSRNLLKQQAKLERKAGHFAKKAVKQLAKSHMPHPIQGLLDTSIDLNRASTPNAHAHADVNIGVIQPGQTQIHTTNSIYVEGNGPTNTQDTQGIDTNPSFGDPHATKMDIATKTGDMPTNSWPAFSSGGIPPTSQPVLVTTQSEMSPKTTTTKPTTNAWPPPADGAWPPAPDAWSGSMPATTADWFGGLPATPQSAKENLIGGLPATAQSGNDLGSTTTKPTTNAWPPPAVGGWPPAPDAWSRIEAANPMSDSSGSKSAANVVNTNQGSSVPSTGMKQQTFLTDLLGGISKSLHKQ